MDSDVTLRLLDVCWEKKNSRRKGSVFCTVQDMKEREDSGDGMMAPIHAGNSKGLGRDVMRMQLPKFHSIV